MSSRYAYPNPKWVHGTQYLKGYNTPTIFTYNGYGCLRRHLVRFFAQCSNIVFSHALLLKQSSLFEYGDGSLFFKLLGHSIADRDVIANRFYRTFFATTNSPRPDGLGRKHRTTRWSCYHSNHSMEVV